MKISVIIILLFCLFWNYFYLENCTIYIILTLLLCFSNQIVFLLAVATILLASVQDCDAYPRRGRYFPGKPSTGDSTGDLPYTHS